MDKILLFLLCASIGAARKVYPWGGGDVHERAEDILEGLRKNIYLNVFEDSISKTFTDEYPSLYLKNNEGIQFVAKQKSVEILKSIEVSEPTGMELYDVKALDAQLRASCAVMGMEYWNYEWCHKRYISQFHIEQSANGIVKSPEFSLGKFDRSVYTRENGADAHDESAAIVKVIDYFTGGQPCDENGEQRSTEVHIQCCEGTTMTNYIPTDMYFAEKRRAGGPPMPKATLNAIEEPNTCAYKATVCTPLLCQRNKPTPTADDEGGPGGRGVLTDLMATLNITCLMRQEEWWTYELCFSKGIRQLRINLEQSVLPDGTVEQKQVVANQYILGNPLIHEYSNETALAARINSASTSSSSSSSSGAAQPKREEMSAKEAQIIATSGLVSPLFLNRGREPKFLELQFDNGTACDLDDVNRSTVVEMYCGKTSQIVSIWEDSTCHYRMRVEHPALCALPDFVPKKDNISTIEIVPINLPADMLPYGKSSTRDRSDDASEDSGESGGEAAQLPQVLHTLFEAVLGDTGVMDNKVKAALVAAAAAIAKDRAAVAPQPAEMSQKEEDADLEAVKAAGDESSKQQWEVSVSAQGDPAAAVAQVLAAEALDIEDMEAVVLEGFSAEETAAIQDRVREMIRQRQVQKQLTQTQQQVDTEGQSDVAETGKEVGEQSPVAETTESTVLHSSTSVEQVPEQVASERQQEIVEVAIATEGDLAESTNIPVGESDESSSSSSSSRRLGAVVEDGSDE